MSADRRPNPDEESAILAALPALVRSPRFDGGIASVLLEGDDYVLDGGVVLGATPEVFVRPPFQPGRAGLDLLLALLERRRSQLAHEVSGPATGVLAALETVLEYEPIPESTRSLLEEARLGILRLTSVLADRTAALSGPPNVIAGPLGALLTRMVGAVAASVDPDGERLDVRVHGSNAEVRVDAVVLEGALAVLVANAWRHRRAHGVRVTVEAIVEGELLLVSVSDDGRGLDVAALRRAGEVGFTTRASGAGLGLFLLRRAVSARGGAVVLEALDPGLRATVVLPLSASRDA